jgi:hypothetical protein
MNVRFRALPNTAQTATLGAFETVRISAELGRLQKVWFRRPNLKGSRLAVLHAKGHVQFNK